MTSFDCKFGPGLLDNVPLAPGVYRFLDASGAVLYVGKAKRLRRRLAQYRLATRKKKDRRMRRVVRQAAALVWEVTATHLDACLLEIRMIQRLRPPLNVSGAYCFLYPYIGLRADNGQLSLALTTRPGHLDGFAFFGAFRSREHCREAFFSLVQLLTYIGHREPAKRRAAVKLPRGSHVVTFRRLPGAWLDLWADFLRGSTRDALTELALALLESVGARARAASVQEELDALVRFWTLEALPLRMAMEATGYAGVYPVAQDERDPLFLRFRVGSVC